MHELGVYISKEHGNLLIIRDKTPGIKLPRDIVFSEEDPFLQDIAITHKVSLKAIVNLLKEATKEG